MEELFELEFDEELEELFELELDEEFEELLELELEELFELEFDEELEELFEPESPRLKSRLERFWLLVAPGRPLARSGENTRSKNRSTAFCCLFCAMAVGASVVDASNTVVRTDMIFFIGHLLFPPPEGSVERETMAAGIYSAKCEAEDCHLERLNTA